MAVLRGFGEGLVDYRASSSDDGKPTYASPMLFAIWNALKAERVEMPYPRRVVEMRHV